MKASRLIALILALAMVFSLAACGGKPAEPASATAKPDSGSTAAPAPAATSYTIGINTWGSGVPVLDMFGDAKEYTLTTLGHKVNRMSDDFTADKELQNVQNMCPRSAWNVPTPRSPLHSTCSWARTPTWTPWPVPTSITAAPSTWTWSPTARPWPRWPLTTAAARPA